MICNLLHKFNLKMNEVLEAFSIEKDSLLSNISEANDSRDKLMEENRTLLSNISEVKNFITL